MRPLAGRRWALFGPTGPGSGRESGLYGGGWGERGLDRSTPRFLGPEVFGPSSKARPSRARKSLPKLFCVRPREPHSEYISCLRNSHSRFRNFIPKSFGALTPVPGSLRGWGRPPALCTPLEGPGGPWCSAPLRGGRFPTRHPSAHREGQRTPDPSSWNKRRAGLFSRWGGGWGRESGHLLFPKRALNLIFPPNDPGLFRLMDGRVTLP